MYNYVTVFIYNDLSTGSLTHKKFIEEKRLGNKILRMSKNLDKTTLNS
ncbi:MAG: hypothetical protein QXV12_01225 [Candidatus Rehaiarchaeum fermentans]|nr:hypothetical protein [Candidatus Rehaiarchaeum fermentans]